MATLAAASIADLMTATLKKLKPPVFYDISQALVRYEVMARWLRKDKIQVDGGVGVQKTLMVNASGSAAHVGLYEADNVNVVDVLQTINIPWRHARSFWAFERREILMNRGEPQKIVDIVKARRERATLDLADELEAKGWTAPGGSDTLLPYGLPYYIVKNATTGFNGGAPTGHTTVAGLNPTTYAKWKNYTFTYGATSRSDLISKWRTAARATDFVSPIAAPAAEKITDDYRFYTNETLYGELEQLADQSNDNLGFKFNGNTLTFNGNSIVYVPKLDADTQHPLYGINHSTFYPVVLKGDYLEESEPRTDGAHNVFRIFVDLSYNFLCVDRRRNFVAYKA